ncbi:GNAT family protein [Cronobacter malonaticus]|uniref:GNAT family N-acetyltransferase n=1 Tax=Cronobacter malonaticus TaxID=413503 RepID=UPI000CFDB4CE|nr:GNAT family protein [Cronobacter malonaticus]ELY2622504.1 GNAT family N-acetyltransferase [Cronobacter malonaticus]ELY3622376.1 GNAT family N-acetyltransferase [Cronobacter malonaticus]
MKELNSFGQYVGQPVAEWTPRELPQKKMFAGHFCHLEPVSVRHALALHHAWHSIDDTRDWTYLADERPPTLTATEYYLRRLEAAPDAWYFTVLENISGQPTGTLCLMNVDKTHGVIEIGNVNWSPAMKRTHYGTEAIYLLLAYVFEELKYRRCEWKTDELNTPAIQAAQRLGFIYEGTFRECQVRKGRNSNVNWYSIVEAEWPHHAKALRAWLRPENFNDRGRQIKHLKEFKDR